MIETLAFVLTGIGLAASIVYYANILNNANKTRELQLQAQKQAAETRQTQLFMDIYQTLLESRYGEAHRKIMLSEWGSTEDFLKDYDWYNKELEYTPMLKAIDFMSAFYEGVGVLVREGLIDIRMVVLMFGGVTRTTWEKLKPFVVDCRDLWDSPRWLSEFEFLYNELIRYMKEHPETAT